MSDCTHCKHARWDRANSGRLSPTGDGRCVYPYKLPALPPPMYWLGNPTPCGGYINRHKQRVQDCPYCEETK